MTLYNARTSGVYTDVGADGLAGYLHIVQPFCNILRGLLAAITTASREATVPHTF